MNQEEYWENTIQALTWPDGSGPDLIVDDGGDATMLCILGLKAERIYKESQTLPCPGIILLINTFNFGKL
jgi:S-adenosylhomocysteine hydrolase